MGVAQWMRVVDTVSGLVQMSGRFRRGPGTDVAAPIPGAGPLGQLEARLAGVVVAALKEAFDRDRVRMDLERAQMESERQRAEDALRAELRRQAAERALAQLRLVGVMAFVICMVSVAVGVWLPGMRSTVARTLMGTGFLLAVAALGCVFAAWQHVFAWSTQIDSAVTPASAAAVPSHPQHRAATAAPWLLLASLGLTLATVMTALAS
jgi:hypothetical protein